MSGEVIALFSALLWAMASVLLVVGTKRLPVLPLNLIRCLVSTTFFWTLLPLYGGFRSVASIPLTSWVWLLVSVLGLLVIGDTLYFRAMDLAGVSWAMPVVNINPLWSVLLAALLVDEPLTWSLLAGTILVIAGVTLLSKPVGQATGGRQVEPKERRTGLLLAFAASLLWGIGHVALKPGTEGIHSIVANSARQPMAAVLLLGINLVRGRWQSMFELDRKSWIVIILASVLGTGFGTLFFVMAVQRVGAGPTAVLTSVSPLLAIPFSLIWLQERPTRWTVAGTLLTTMGVVLVTQTS